MSEENPFCRDVRLFHEKFGIGYDGLPRILPPHLFYFYTRFIREELQEYEEAALSAVTCLIQQPLPGQTLGSVEEHLSKALHELVDTLYILLGMAYAHGFDLQAAWDRIHAANMAKIKALPSDSSYKLVVKPPGWKPASLLDLCQNNAHK